MLGVVAPEIWGWTDRIVEWTVGMGLYGLVSGVGFGSLLALREGRRTILDISLRRAVIWRVLGGTFAPAAIAIARRAELRAAEDRKLLRSEPSRG